MLFSDGFVPYEETAPDRNTRLAARLILDYERIGLDGILQEKRERELDFSATSHIDQEEATAVAITFG